MEVSSRVVSRSIKLADLPEETLGKIAAYVSQAPREEYSDLNFQVTCGPDHYCALSGMRATCRSLRSAAILCVAGLCNIKIGPYPRHLDGLLVLSVQAVLSLPHLVALKNVVSDRSARCRFDTKDLGELFQSLPRLKAYDCIPRRMAYGCPDGFFSKHVGEDYAMMARRYGMGMKRLSLSWPYNSPGVINLIEESRATLEKLQISGMHSKDLREGSKVFGKSLQVVELINCRNLEVALSMLSGCQGLKVLRLGRVLCFNDMLTSKFCIPSLEELYTDQHFKVEKWASLCKRSFVNLRVLRVAVTDNDRRHTNVWAAVSEINSMSEKLKVISIKIIFLRRVHPGIPFSQALAPLHFLSLERDCELGIDAEIDASCRFTRVWAPFFSKPIC